MKNTIVRLGVSLAAIFFLGFAAAPALADDGVARLSVVDGTVTVQHGEGGTTEAGAINAPLNVGDYLSTGDGSRAEVQIDNQNFLRVASNAQLRFSHLDPSNDEVQLAAGTLELRTFGSGDDNVQVDTPSTSVRSDQGGAYRVDVDSNGNTTLTVRSGSADILTPQGRQTVASGTSVAITGSASNPQIGQIETISYDDFDQWNAQRDQYDQAGIGVDYANPSIVGLDDLDTYGQWVMVADYGDVWVPYSQGSDWAPYQDGQWAWEPYYGWTWVADEPWGWAPYHYGRWFYQPAYGWCWYPGSPFAPAAYEPAEVAFFGFGGGGGFSFGISLSFGNVGWVPLAPGETFRPWWGGGFSRNVSVTNVNITNVNITNINITKYYRNARAPHAIAAVTVRDFQNGVFNHHVAAQARELANARFVNSELPIHPSTANLRVSQRSVRPQNVAPLSERFRTMPETRPVTGLRSTPVKAVSARQPFSAATSEHPNSTAALAGRQAPVTAWDRFNTGRGFGSMQAAGASPPVRSNVQAARSNVEASRPNAAAHSNVEATRSNVEAARRPVTAARQAQTETPASPWDRFDNSRGVAATDVVGRSNDDQPAVRSNNGVRPAPVSAPSRPTSARNEMTAAPQSVWDRFNQGTDRGTAVQPRASQAAPARRPAIQTRSTYQQQPSYQPQRAFGSQPVEQSRPVYRSQSMPAAQAGSAWGRFGASSGRDSSTAQPGTSSTRSSAPDRRKHQPTSN